MHTSYFAKYKKSNGVSIAVRKPWWFPYDEYKDLFPPEDLVYRYKSDKITTEEYIEEYHNKVLSRLDAKKVYEDLKDKVILCYEKSNEFCHRHLVAIWIENKLGIKIEEWRG
jgi:uncharacterized protein YeaO (DUF488 family)